MLAGQFEGVVLQAQQVRFSRSCQLWFEDQAEFTHGSMQAIGCRVTIQVWPKRLHHLLSSQSIVPAAQEAPQQGAGASALPVAALAGFPRSADFPFNAKLAEGVDAYLLALPVGRAPQVLLTRLFRFGAHLLMLCSFHGSSVYFTLSNFIWVSFLCLQGTFVVQVGSCGVPSGGSR